tara:strand:+ start:784 stop:1137 length:354 start_codon:yes stop_codon:yes gene_type:complete
MAFVYIWTHTPTQRWYLGSRTAFGCHTQDGYICSSDLIKQDILTHRDEWSRAILAEGHPTEMLTLEVALLDRLYAIDNERSLNQTNGTGRISYKKPVRYINTERLKDILIRLNYNDE